MIVLGILFISKEFKYRDLKSADRKVKKNIHVYVVLTIGVSMIHSSEYEILNVLPRFK